MPDKTLAIYTLTGTLEIRQVLTLQNARLPTSDKARHFENTVSILFDSDNCKYDLILDTKFYQKSRYQIKLKARWHGMTLSYQ